ncbi:MAG: MFS transporter, partial [Nitrososphaerota archaeon]|nr:MFS transporter [Nitrososphaerota archaeon]
MSTVILTLGSLRKIPGDIWFTSFLSVIGLIGWSVAMPFFGVYLSVSRGIPLGEVGITYLLSAILSFFSQLVGGRLVDSFGVKPVMRYGYLGTSIAAAVTAYLVIINVNGLLLILLYPLFNFIRGLSQPSISS